MIATMEGGIEDATEAMTPLAENDSSAPSPAESLRLIQAFLAVSDPAERAMVIEYVERIAALGRTNRP